jgi:peptidoglycan/LPS O-acetylase OafA/YrhL
MHHKIEAAPTVYRADIDGLRAVAVLLVVAFHAFPLVITGGFVGVDIFFVISGFLISNIILNDLKRDAFSFSEFYARRVRRIFPALVFVLFACFIFGYFALLDFEYKNLGKHIAGGAGFISNILLWRESGYFDAASETKPLLHLWSLGIEEQFYLAWPLLLWITWRSRKSVAALAYVTALALALFFLIFHASDTIIGHRRFFLQILLETGVAYLIFFRVSAQAQGMRIFAVIGVFLVGSFALNILTIRGGDLAAAFYSPVTRFWELLVGGGLAYMSIFNVKPRLLLSSFLQSTIGAILLGAAFFLITDKTPFPGWWALLPTSGTFYILSAGPNGWVNRFILSNRILVAIGTVSYPLYLWHWPLLSFSKILSNEPPSVAIRLAAVAISFVLAALTYVFIEKPVRFGKFKPQKTFALIALAGCALLAGFTCYIQSGFPSRFSIPKTANTLAKTFNTDLPFTLHNQACESRFPELKELAECRLSANGNPDIVLLGDSHSGMYYDALAARLPNHIVMNIGEHSCLPFSAAKLSELPSCSRRTRLVIDFLKNEKSIKEIILVGYWTYLASGRFQNIENRSRDVVPLVAAADAISFQRSANTFLSALDTGDRRIFVFEDTPNLGFNPMSCFRIHPIKIFESIRRPCAVSRASVDNISAPSEEIVRNVVKHHPNVMMYNPRPLFCDKALCWGTRDNLSLYWDSDHLTKFGADLVISDFVGKQTNLLP